MVSSATPTVMRIEVPPNGNWLDAPDRQHHRRDQRDHGEVDRAGERDAREDVVEVGHRGRPGPDARDEPALLADVVGGVHGVERDRRVEVGEEDHQQAEREHVDQARLVDDVALHEAREAPARDHVLQQDREVQHRRREDDRDHAGGVHLERDVRAAARGHLPAHHAFRELHRDPPLPLLEIDHRHDDGERDREDHAERDRAALREDRVALGGQAARSRSRRSGPTCRCRSPAA